jgi:hypothetical protein
VAVTAILADDADRLMSVNGPPGTGKTTLLRDVYANVVTARAHVMVGFEDPLAAFGPPQEVSTTGSGRSAALHAPDPRLCGYEMLVASSNNAAVENVSQALPACSGVSAEWVDRLSYFKLSANSATMSTADGKESVTRPGLLGEVKAWGFAAAVLGNRARVATFGTIAGRWFSDSLPGTHLLKALEQPCTPQDWGSGEVPLARRGRSCRGAGRATGAGERRRCQARVPVRPAARAGAEPA